MFSKLNLEDHFEKWEIPYPSCILDTFKATIIQPCLCGWEFFVSANTYCVKYEIACSIGVPRIIWCSGPYKGAGNDGTIASVGCVASYLNENEAIAADKAYRFLGPRFVTHRQLRE